ncbi:cobaltochelatase subunit CobN [Marichromatium bheemlicum]|uniref:Cobaltochelatase subunit CobN n=1 Tax=Marichromatium bheemlicum TaxID=365339 RepID=A0ABX1IBH5_9GAMM|nr:cobaltochelatase subunit CobN [Marichromatium bheemlicum]NKN34394.1 cobaltochelatase subunit CobN [Marichromatium bheemlicum]
MTGLGRTWSPAKWFLVGSIIALILVSLIRAPTPQGADTPASDVLILSTDFVLSGKFETVTAAAREAGLRVLVHNLDQAAGEALSPLLAQTRLVLIDAPRTSDAQQVLGQVRGELETAGTPWLLVTAKGPQFGLLDAEHATRLYDYYRQGGVSNFERLFAYLRHQLWGEGLVDVAPPLIFPEHGIYHPEHPDLVLDDLDEYLAWVGPERAATQPRVGVVIYRSAIANAQTDDIDDLVRRIEQAGALPVVFYHPIMPGSGDLDLVWSHGQAAIDVLINYQLMYLSKRSEDYERLGVPVLQAIRWRRGDRADWESSTEGIAMSGVPFYLAIPEQAGLIDPLVVTAVEDGRLVAIPDQAQALVDKALRLVRLGATANADKRVAVMFYNYPPGEKNLAASFLNVPRSLAQLSRSLAEAGYRVEPVDETQMTTEAPALLAPFYRPETLTRLLDQGLAERLPMADYEAWFATLPAPVRERIEARWGPARESPMVIEEAGAAFFVIPRIQRDRLVILPQPPRGQAGESAERSIYHDTRVPVNHFYLASYLYVRESFGADALIHLGTHGTQEWMPGKERGLSIADDPYLVLGDLPVAYPYIVDNIGEAVQAKRRGRAVTVSHQTPPFAPAGLHQALMPIHDLLHEWALLDQGAVKQQTEQAIIDEARALNLLEDLSCSAADAAADFIAFERALHDYLHDLAQSAQPLGLHTLGQAPEPSQRLITVMQMLGDELYRLLPLDAPDELFVDDYQRLTESAPYRFLERHLLDGEPVEDERAAELVERAGEYYAKLAAADEWAGLATVLNGRHLATRYGGDPIRNPESLPTGRNHYGFDPSKLPTEQAYTAGGAALATLIETHRREQGQAPRKLAFSLWSIEAMRHLGVLESQVFHALGVRPVWDRSGRITDVEVIPRAALGRARIDVVVSATGLYRDHFPRLMELIARAVALVAELDEPDNAVRINTLALEQRFLAEGMAADEARELALTRVFSSQSGAYGTNLDAATLASDTWEDEGKLAELYLQRMQYAYGPERAHWGRTLDDLNLYAEQLKGVEGAVLARSSNLYGMLSTDDPFQYLGGLALAVRHLTGQSPSLYISNLRDPQAQDRIDSAARFLATELRARYHHPQWIEAMQAEGYGGTLNIVDTLNNFWGWQATAPEIVRDDQWQTFFEVYVEDALGLDLDEWFETHNPTALAQVVERMLEAVRKDYWEASEETLSTLVEVYQDAVERHGYQAASSQLEPYVRDLVAGFGREGRVPPDAEAAAGRPTPVSGQVLTPQQPHEAASVPPAQVASMLLLLMAVTAGGALRQWRTAHELV